jgi:inner membrane protein
MSTVVSHAVAGLALSVLYAKNAVPPRFWVLSVLCAALPDVDGLGLHCGIPYAHMFGHRGFFHSLCFAALLGLLVACFAFANVRKFSRSWCLLWLYFTLVTASHGITDACTDGGLGVAFFAPFDHTRYFFSWRPLVVPPVHFFAMFSSWGVEVVVSELLYIWLPAISVAALALACRRWW